jgi:hypothetical protein
VSGTRGSDEDHRDEPTEAPEEEGEQSAAEKAVEIAEGKEKSGEESVI